MKLNDINTITKFFTEYNNNSQKGKYYYHNEDTSFKIIITPNNELYQLDRDHEIYGIELITIKDLKTRFKSFTGYNLDDIIEFTIS